VILFEYRSLGLKTGITLCELMFCTLKTPELKEVDIQEERKNPDYTALIATIKRTIVLEWEE